MRANIKFKKVEAESKLPARGYSHPDRVIDIPAIGEKADDFAPDSVAGSGFFGNSVPQLAWEAL